MDGSPLAYVALPADAVPPFDVFVSGALWEEGTDYTVDGRWLKIVRPLAARPKRRLGLGGRALMSAGVGVYSDAVDSVDLRYRTPAGPRTATGLPVVPAPDPARSD